MGEWEIELGLVMSFTATSCQPAFGDSGSGVDHFLVKISLKQKYLANAE